MLKLSNGSLIHASIQIEDETKRSISLESEMCAEVDPSPTGKGNLQGSNMVRCASASRPKSYHSNPFGHTFDYFGIKIVPQKFE